jgi:hypothetical protein
MRVIKNSLPTRRQRQHHSCTWWPPVHFEHFAQFCPYTHLRSRTSWCQCSFHFPTCLHASTYQITWTFLNVTSIYDDGRR